jgi:3-deoxy-manno-octulosonate cytidylyltransferase (CMP-KDO synthetase)
MANVLIVIPARMQATRLADKPMADIAGEPMIAHVWRRAMESGAGRVVVATDTEAIRDAVEQAGGEAVITRADHESGTDRVHEAADILDPGRNYSIVVNLQGDLPTLEPRLIGACIAPLEEGDADIATLAAEIADEAEKTNPDVVKAVGTRDGAANWFRALYFTRATAPYGDGPLYHHIGIYAFRRDALERFVSLSRSELEIRERLEQLRALEAGMRIDFALVDTVPIGVDTPADLERARALLGATSR